MRAPSPGPSDHPLPRERALAAGVSIALTMTAVTTEKSVRNQLFINGEFVDAKSGKTFPTINPATEEKIADVASAGPEDVDVAVRAARAQMEPASEWQRMKPRDRAKILWRLAD